MPARIIPTTANHVTAPTARHLLGVPVIDVPYPTSKLPFVANWYRHEMLWSLLRNVIVREVLRGGLPRAQTIIHAQHVQSVPGAVEAGAELGVPVVATVRDHWPWDYFATGLHGDRVPFPSNTVPSLATDLVARLGPLPGTLATLAIPSMLAHLKRRQMFLARADAVVAVSRYIARRLPPVVSEERVHVLPNIVDVAAIERVCATPAAIDVPESFVLFVGKLEHNKGAHLLPSIMRSARTAVGDRTLPTLVVAGNGTLSASLTQQCAESNIPLHILPGWTDHDDVLRLMHRAEVLLFPSAWGEPFSRVPLEASAVGACILAMPTGGTPEIIEDGTNGVLASDVASMGQALAHLLVDDERRTRLRMGASRRARERWGPDVVAAQVERLYEHLMS